MAGFAEGKDTHSLCRDCGESTECCLTYTVTEKQALCTGCLDRKPDAVHREPNEPVWKCAGHETKAVELICRTCGYRGICQVCAMTVHAGHLLECVEKLETKLRLKLQQQTDHLASKKRELGDRLKILQEQRRKVEEKYSELNVKIEITAEAKSLQVESAKNEAVQAIHREADMKIALINAQREASLKQNVDNAVKWNKTIELRLKALKSKLSRYTEENYSIINSLENEVQSATESLSQEITLFQRMASCETKDIIDNAGSIDAFVCNEIEELDHGIIVLKDVNFAEDDVKVGQLVDVIRHVDMTQGSETIVTRDSSGTTDAPFSLGLGTVSGRNETSLAPVTLDPASDDIDTVLGTFYAIGTSDDVGTDFATFDTSRDRNESRVAPFSLETVGEHFETSLATLTLDTVPLTNTSTKTTFKPKTLKSFLFDDSSKTPRDKETSTFSPFGFKPWIRRSSNSSERAEEQHAKIAVPFSLDSHTVLDSGARSSAQYTTDALLESNEDAPISLAGFHVIDPAARSRSGACGTTARDSRGPASSRSHEFRPESSSTPSPRFKMQFRGPLH